MKKISLFFCSILFLISSCDSNPFDNQTFNQELWQKNPVIQENNHNIRLYMSEDIINNHLKIGMTKEETRQLLGKPDSSDSTSDNYLLGEYWLKLTFKDKKLMSKEIISI